MPTPIRSIRLSDEAWGFIQKLIKTHGSADAGILALACGENGSAAQLDAIAPPVTAQTGKVSTETRSVKMSQWKGPLLKPSQKKEK